MNASEFAQYRNDYAYFNTADGNDAVGDGTRLANIPIPTRSHSEPAPTG